MPLDCWETLNYLCSPERSLLSPVKRCHWSVITELTTLYVHTHFTANLYSIILVIAFKHKNTEATSLE